MKNIHLISGVNEPYLEKAIPFIESADVHSNANNIIVTLDFIIPETISKQFPNISFVYLDSANVEAKNSNTCLQHGGFLKALKNIPENDIIIFTDADIIVQRAFSSSELKMISNLKELEIGVGYNKATDQTLAQEFQSLDPSIGLGKVSKIFPEVDKLAVYNTGVVIAQKATYQRLYDIYIKNWGKIVSACKHYAKQQWLLSYIIQNNFKPVLLASEIHTHAHYPVHLRVSQEYGYKFCIENTPVVLSHHIPPCQNIDFQKKEQPNPSAKKLKRKIKFLKLISTISIITSIILLGIIGYIL